MIIYFQLQKPLNYLIQSAEYTTKGKGIIVRKAWKHDPSLVNVFVWF